MKNLFVFLGIVFALLGSCSGDSEKETITLPPTPVLQSRTLWAVNLTRYLRVRALPQGDSEPLTILAKGELLKIIERSLEKENIGDNTDYWYKIEDGRSRGWVYGSHLEIFSTKKEAETRSQEIK
ncbi:MAG: SH3 domain-containing protein [Spirochaetales bacterium]|nr:SH3 domain-containing protein [Spirochaetales bacterium]